MNAQLDEGGIPGWVWWTLGGVTLSGLAGLLVWLGRAPRYDALLRRAGVPEAIHTLAALQRHIRDEARA